MATPASQLITQSLFQQAEQESLRNFSCLLRLQVYLLSQIHGAIESRLLSRGVFRCPETPQNPNFPLYLHHIETLNITNDLCMKY